MVGAVPTRNRWQPIRGGLINLYRFDEQEFRYQDGRLLLRGNNGTGKSRVLALQLPFLLDGEIIPQRVEPDGDSAKRMEWNLLLGGKYDDRLGYTWIEFGRVNEQGEAEYKTLGCALRAVQGRGIVQQWLFITNQRIGHELFLENELGQPLTKGKLEAALGDRGKLYGSGKIEEDRHEYRRAVDNAFFKLGDRYEALVNLLIQLRQPQLSRTLNEQRLSDALSQALPPLPESVLGDVAEAFRSLEADRQELGDLMVARDSAERFLKEYRRYIQIAARRRAEEVRKAHSAYETTMRRLRAAEDALEQAQRALEATEKQVAQLETDEQHASAEERTLRDSPEMKDARTLEEARLAAEGAKADAVMAEREAMEAAERLGKEQRQQETAMHKAARAWEQAGKLAAATLEAAQPVGLETRHREAVERLGLPDIDESRVEAVAAALREVVKRRLDGAQRIEELNRQAEVARQRVASAQESFASAESDLNESIEAERRALAGLESERLALLAAYRVWAGGVTETRPVDADELEYAFGEWCEAPQGESPLARAVRETEQQASHRIAAQRAEVASRLEIARVRERELGEELSRLQSGYHQPPPVPYTRDPAARTSRPGAPLWALCEFLPTAADADRANIEAALESSGLLDAWVTPDGRLLDGREHDTLLMAGSSERAPEGRSLASILAPAIDPEHPQGRAVSESTVAAVLAHIGLGPGSGQVWVDQSGRWQVGPLHGAWNKPVAQHLGHASREAARRRRIAEVEVELEGAGKVIGEIQGELENCDARAAQLRRESAAAPVDGAVRHAMAQSSAAREVVSGRRVRLTEAESRLTERRRVAAAAAAQRDEVARDLGLLEWVNNTGGLIRAIHDYQQLLAEFWPAVRVHAEARIQLADAGERMAEAVRQRGLRDGTFHELEGIAAAAAAKFEILESTIGASVREVRQRLEEALVRLQRVRADKKAAEEEKTSRRVEIAVAQKESEQASADLQARNTERESVVGTFKVFVSTRQLGVAHSDFAEAEAGAWSVARAVDLARRIEAALIDVDHSDGAWSRNQREILGHFETLQTSLRAHGQMPEASMSDGLFVVSIHFQGRPCTIADLRDNVVGIIQDRQELLDAREREVLENYLINEVAEKLHDLLHSALHWKEEINKELRERPMSTGMTLRFAWEPLADLSPAFAEARRLLLGARGTWSPTERSAVGDFLQQQIKAVRAANDTGTWQDHLAEAFDYRKWHQFGIERRQDGVWKRLTRRSHGTGSGGEKAVALTLPQLAAAAAHYRTADPSAPRLILLDEVFVGVDKNMRAKCMDLLQAFDLDVVMTSESEWACYPTVPAIAIYQLAAREGIDAVHATRWVWNGRERVRDDSPMPAHRPPETLDAVSPLESR
jgi:uncharacterized protein (TIGR02680 family)